MKCEYHILATHQSTPLAHASQAQVPSPLHAPAREQSQSVRHLKAAVDLAQPLPHWEVEESCVSIKITPRIYPLYTFIAVYAPIQRFVCTRHTCIYTIHTPLNTSKHPYTPYIHQYMVGTWEVGKSPYLLTHTPRSPPKGSQP